MTPSVKLLSNIIKSLELVGDESVEVIINEFIIYYLSTFLYLRGTSENETEIIDMINFAKKYISSSKIIEIIRNTVNYRPNNQYDMNYLNNLITKLS